MGLRVEGLGSICYNEKSPVCNLPSRGMIEVTPSISLVRTLASCK